jgi:P-type Ca2+ transporter type 2C
VQIFCNLRIALDVLREPMFLLLVACGVIYLMVGDMQEPVMLLAFIFFVMGITLYQERKKERALDALRELSSPRALVNRQRSNLSRPRLECSIS